jgi:hypothetical protein
MTAKKQNKSNFSSYSVKGGVFQKLCKETDEGAVNVGTADKPVWVENYEEITGQIAWLAITEHQKKDGTGKYQKLSVTLVDSEGCKEYISMYYPGKASNSILSKLPSINWEEEVTLKPFRFASKEGKLNNQGEVKIHEGITVTQNGEKILFSDRIPAAKQNKKGTWDFSEVELYYENTVIPDFQKYAKENNLLRLTDGSGPDLELPGVEDIPF